MIETQYPLNYLKQKVVDSENFNNPDVGSSKRAQEFYGHKRYRRFDSDDERNKNRELFTAIRNNELQQVEELLKAGVKCNIIDKNNKNNTPLHYAVERDKKEIIEALLQEKDVDIDAKNILGNTPLHIAVSKDNQKLVKLLLDHEAKPNIMNNSNKTPLNLAKELDSTNPNKQVIIQMLDEINKSEDNIKHDQPMSNLVKNTKLDINDISVFVDRTIYQQDFEVWLKQKDIANIARINYGWYGDDNEVIFEVIGSVDQFGKQLTQEKIYKLINSKKLSLTFIVNLGVQHWVTLVITIQKKDISAYYADPVGKKIPKELRDKLKEIIEDVNVIQAIINEQQGDKHNSGIFALENAKIINDKIKAGQTTNEEIKQALEDYKPTSDDLKLMRKMFAEQLIFSEVIENESKNRKLSLVKTQNHGEMSIANNDNKQKISGSIEIPLSRTYSKSGLVYSLHGDSYQLKLLMLFVKRALDKGYIFELATEMDNAEKFDDVVFRYKKNKSDKWIGRFLQAKHKQDKSKKSITVNDLLTTNADNEFSLQKYFTSYRKIKENSVFKDQFNKDFVICTNMYLKFDGKKKKNSELTITEDIFNKETDECGILNSELLQFKKEFSGREKIVSVLNDAPDFNKLAKVLIECVLEDKSINNDKSENSLDENVFISYQYALINKVIVKETHKLSNEFIKGKDLPPEIQNLRNAFRKQFDDRRKSFNLDDDPKIGDEKIEPLVKDIVDLIKNPIRETYKGLAKIEKGRDSIKENFDKLAGHVLVKKNGNIMFSSAFLNNNKDLPGDLNKFRKIFLKKISENNVDTPLDQLIFIVYKDFKACPEIYVDKNNFWENIKETELKLFPHFGVQDNNIKPIDTFVEKFVSMLKEEESLGNNIIRIKRDNSIISKNIDKLSYYALIEKNDEIKFTETFLKPKVPQLPGNLNEFWTQLKAKMKEFSIEESTLKNFKFVINNFPKFDLPNDSTNQIEEHIEEFLNDLKFAVDQPNEVQLGEIIKEELGREFNPTDRNNVYARFLEEILDWMKDKEGKYFTDEEGKDLFKEIKKEILGEIWFDVKDPVLLNVEREQKLKEVHKALQGNQNNDKITEISQVACISGLGGIGKSELARQYANKYGHYYNNNVIWINAESTETMESSFRKLAKDSRLGIPIKDVDGQEKEIVALVQEIYRFFGQGKRKSLFIFDNAEKYDISDKTKNIGIKEFLPTMPPENKPYILITSRFQTWDKLNVINLEKFSETEAKSFIQKALRIQEDDDNVLELAKKLNYFPLALQQAVAFIKKKDEENTNIDPYNKFTIKNYLKKFDGGEAQELLSFPLSNDISNLYPETTLTTWKVTFDHIKKNELLNGKQALEILDVIAYFAPDNIPTRMFSKYGDGREKSGVAVQILEKYSLINLEKSMFSVSSLVQRVIRINSKDREKEILKKALNLFKDYEGYQIDKNLGPYYVNHAMSVWRYASSNEELVKEEGNLAIFLGAVLKAQGNLDEAYQIFDKVYDKRKEILGSDHSDTLTAFGNVAIEISKQEKHDQPLSNPDENTKLDINDISVFVEKTIYQQDFEVWLKQKDIANIARINYGSYGDDNKVMFKVIGSVDQLGKQLNHESIYELIFSKKLSLTFIINLGVQHWVTLVITIQKKDISAYYADPVGKKIPKELRDKLKEIIEDVNVIQAIINEQQGDKHNSGIFALENAKIINDKIKAGQTTNEEIKQALEDYKPTSDDLKLMRKMFAEQLIFSEVIENESKNRKLSLVKTQNHGEMSIANNDNKQKISGSIEIPLPRTYSKSGLVYSLHGKSYQLKLLMLFVKRALDKGYIFELATEMDNAEKFDDVVFRYKKNKSDKWIGRFLQAKHKQDKSKKSITVNDLLTMNADNEFSLQKYFTSYRKIKENSDFKDQFNKDFVICTNMCLKFDGKKKKNSELTITEDIFNKETDECGILNSELLQFKKEFSGREKIVSVLNDAPDFNKLAKVLIECVLEDKSINNDKSENSLDENVFISYQYALINKVIVKETHKLSNEFINGKDLPPEIQNLRNAFRKQFDDRRKSFNLVEIPYITNELLKEDLEKDEIIEKFANTIIKKMTKSSASPGKIDKKPFLIRENFDKLAGHVLVKKNGNIMFSTAFLNNNKDLPGDLNKFRKIFLKKISENYPDTPLDQLKFEVNNFKTCPEIYVDKNNFWENIKETELKLFPHFGVQDNNIKPIDTFVEKFVSMLKEEESLGNNIIRIKRDNSIISKNIDKLSYYALIEKNDEIKFTETFLKPKVPQLPGNLNEFWTQLKAKMKEFSIEESTLKNFKFVINNFPKFDLPNDSTNQIEEHIEEFLNDLKFAVDQPNEVQLGEIIKEELGREFNPTDRNNVYARFLEEILDWMKDKEGKYFTDEEGKDLFKEIKKEILGEIWFDVKDPVLLNVEREQKLKEVHKALQGNQNNDKITEISQVACISGLGGIGKSELARQYANKYGHYYNNNVIWINAESTETMESSFRKLAKDSRLGIPIKDVDGQEKEIEALVQEIYRFFGQGKRKSLFIFDNAEKYDISDKTKNIGIKEFLPTMPPENKPYILITSRFQTWDKLNVINLEKFSETEAKSFIQKALRIQEDDDNVLELAKKLNYFPLALQQAVAFIKKKDEENTNIDPYNKFTIKNYLKKFDGGEAQELLSFPLSNDISNLYPETTLTTWKVTFDHIKKNELLNGKQALEILDVIAYFAPDNIPTRMFSKYGDGREKSGVAVQILEKYSLINSEKSMFSVSSLVQLVIRINSEDREKEILKKALNLFKDYEGYQIDKNLGPYYVNHAMSVWRYASSHEELLKELDNLAIFVVGELDKNQRSKEAISFGNKALKLLEKKLGLNNPTFQCTLDGIASVFFKSGIESNKHGNYDDAFEKFSLLLNQAQENSIISSGKIEHNLGSTLLGQGKLDEAREIFEKALRKKEKSLESNAESILKTKNSIGAVLLAQGKLDEAYQIFNDVYNKRQEILGSDHSDTLTALSNIALVLSKQGKYEEAVDILNDIKKKREKLFSSDHSLRLMGRLKVVDILLMQGKFKEALLQCRDIYEEKKKFLGLQYDTLKTLDIWYALAKTFVKRRRTDKYALSELNDAFKERNKVYKSAESTQLVYDAARMKNQVEREDISYEEETYDRDFINLLLFQNDYLFQYSGEFRTPIKNSKYKKAKFLVNCLSPSKASRRKREAASEACLFTWEDIDEFNDEKKEKRDINKINIDSEKFISYIKDLPEEAKNQLIELAAQSQVTGNAQGYMNKLISNKKIASHLDRVGKISRLAMDGMMAKNVLADFLNGDYEGVAINIGFIAGGKGLAKVAEAASLKGLKLIADNKLLLGSSLKVASSFLARGTSAFVVYDLVNQIKEYRNGSDDALVDIVGDSIYLGVDSAEIGVELAETFGLLEGVSSVTGPIGAAIGAVIFVGTDVYKAMEKVNKIDQLIHLTRTEKFVEGLRAFIGIKPRQYIEDLVEEKQLYNQLVKQGLEYLKLHHDIQNYVFPTSDRKFEFSLNSKILLDQKKSDVKWSRSRPDNVKDAKLFCLPHGNDETPPSYGLYLCENAIGISKNEIGNYTLINLADGKDYAKGFSNSSNIFVVNNGYKEYYGGNRNDLFVLTGNFTGGYLYGQGGIDTLDLTLFARNSSSLDIFLDATIVNGDSSLKIAEMERILGRKDKSERIYTACGTMFLDGQGGTENSSDTVIIRNGVENNICIYNTKIVVRSNTNIINQAFNGEFDYLVLPSKGEAVVNITSLLDGEASDRHNFFFNSTISELLGISIQSESQISDYNVRSVTFSFLSIDNKTEGVFDSESNEKTFNLIVSDIPVNASYTLSNGAQIKIGSKDNSYILEKTLQPVEDVLKDYLPLANRVTNMSFFIQSYLTNETIVIGSGNYEVIHNNPMFKSHLVGNGGENIYVIDSETENTPEIIIHDVDEEKSIDTIDLRNLVRKITGKFEVQIVQSQNNLLLSLIEENLLNGLLSKSNKCTLILKDGVKRYNKTHIIIENVPMVIVPDGNRWNLRPQPLIFDKNEEIIVITSDDVEKGNEIVTPRKGENYKFLRGNDDDLIITNALDMSNDLCSITLSKFYKAPKMKTLLIKFADLEISLKDHMEEINKAKDINFAKKEYLDQVNSEVFDRDPEVIMISDQPVKQKQSHSRQKREAHQDINNKYEPITWINNLCGWFRDSTSGFLSSKSDETFSTESSISSTDISIDVNGTIMLIDMLIRRVTGQKYISSVENSISLLEAQSHSLNIIEEFKKIIEKAALRSGISLHRLNIDFLAAEKEVTDKILRGKWQEISKALITIVEKACPGTETGYPGRLSPKKFHYFKVEFQKELDNLLNQSIKQIVNDGGKVNKNTVGQKINLGSESFLKNTTLENRVTWNKTLMHVN